LCGVVKTKFSNRLARKFDEEFYIVLEDGYHTTDEDGLYTFWNGAKVLATVLPNGEIYLN